MQLLNNILSHKQEFLTLCGCFFSEYSNFSANEACVTHIVKKMSPEFLPRGKKLVSPLLAPYFFKNTVRTISPQILEKIKKSIPELKFTGSYEIENHMNVLPKVDETSVDK